ncbi:uncharacterized protein LOC130054224 isoform X4 [Ostrea edulis]|uniref:uncharacterized protein LOC130054224 isoform X4 n=1 Tax=Ostrea edulis TaxID=37623 RepID=UPI0024AFDF9F|nr:uncharacterized protein LOC130054224 isoform X4 [Ostrea edulis]
MYRRWIYMCLVFYLTLETSYSQCSDDKTCECHCNCCSNCLGFYCTSCNREGWSGLTANGCQRKNIAYNQTTYQKSTNTDSSNAVDEKISTYSRTEVQKNPWIKVKFDKIERVKHMFITLSAELIPSNSTSSTTPYVYVVAVLGGLLLVLTITLVTFFVKRKRERERTIRMTYQTVQVGCQKTDHDYECVSIEHDYGTIDS